MVPVPAESPVFYVDRTEVTVGSYRACVTAGVCTPTWKYASAYDENDPVRKEWRCNYHRKDREDHPINCVSFTAASAYCAWAGKRLPTGPEWTRAARGDDARKYPWGDTMPRCKEVVFARYGPEKFGCSKQPVGTGGADAHPKTASPFGALDMAGSLWEWTTERSPRGFPILRGGSWDSPETGIGIDARLEQSPGNGDITLGFRCVKDAS
jgi:serine/threonine-protein kinase